MPEARTATFVTLALWQLMFALGCPASATRCRSSACSQTAGCSGPSELSAVLQMTVVTVPLLQPFFQVAPLAFAWEWGMIVLLALMPVSVIELTKLVRSGAAASVRGESEVGA